MPRKTERARVSKAKKVKPAERPGSHPTPSETNSATETKVSPRPRTPVPIVAIGASAGGLEALELFFEAMGPESGAAFVIIQHLSPDFPSVMDELLARRTRMRIRAAKGGLAVEPNVVYLRPAQQTLIIEQGLLLLKQGCTEKSR